MNRFIDIIKYLCRGFYVRTAQDELILFSKPAIRATKFVKVDC